MTQTDIDKPSQKPEEIEEDLEFITDGNFEMLKEVQSILKHCTNLTDEQKLAYCTSQRFFMKSYLRNVSKKR